MNKMDSGLIPYCGKCGAMRGLPLGSDIFSKNKGERQCYFCKQTTFCFDAPANNIKDKMEIIELPFEKQTPQQQRRVQSQPSGSDSFFVIQKIRGKLHIDIFTADEMNDLLKWIPSIGGVGLEEKVGTKRYLNWLDENFMGTFDNLPNGDGSCVIIQGNIVVPEIGVSMVVAKK